MNRQRSILLLGGSAAQVEAIKKACELGYRAILCDYLPDNPGRLYADKFYLVSTTDKEAVLKVAQEEHVDGVVAYGSDPAAPTAAYVAEKLGLPSNSYASVSMLCDKEKFRGMLKKGGFPIPSFFTVDVTVDPKELTAFGEKLGWPIIVKPVDSSGSKGVSVVSLPEDLPSAVSYASTCSRKGRVIMEQFISEVSDGIIEAEIFVVDGIVESWVLMRSVRGSGRSSVVPTISIHPSNMQPKQEAAVRREIQRLVSVSGIINGPMNIEIAVSDDCEVYFLDVGPRNGGNLLARFASCVSGKDIVRATIKTALGELCVEDVYYKGNPDSIWVQQILGVEESGFFRGLRKDYPKIGELVELHLFKEPGEYVEELVDASCEVGVAFLKFSAGISVEKIILAIENPCFIDVSTKKINLEEPFISSFSVSGVKFRRVSNKSELSRIWDKLADAFEPPLKECVPNYEEYLEKVALKGISFCCVSDKDERVLGCVSFYANDLESRKAFITEVMVSPYAQGRGLGTAMLAGVEEWALAYGMQTVGLEVRFDNDGARRLYSRLGYSVVGNTDRGFLMEKALGDAGC